MSTVEIACGRCEKKFKVRSEFAGRSTRCPGCSAPITIAAAARPAPPRPVEEEEKPRPRPRPRDDEDDVPRGPVLNWKATDQAFAREQLTAIFGLVSMFASLMMFCVQQAFRSPYGGDEPAILVVVFGALPLLGTAAFGLAARISAISAPRESLARGSAIASVLCAIAGLLSLVLLFIAFVSGMENQRPDEVLMGMAFLSLLLSSFVALVTFVGFTVQVGIYQRSASVSRGVGRLGITAMACLLALLGITLLYTLVAELFTPSPYSDPYGRGGYNPGRGGRDIFVQVVFGMLIPLALGVLLILYHRLLAAGRRAIRNDLADR